MVNDDDRKWAADYGRNARIWSSSGMEKAAVVFPKDSTPGRLAALEELFGVTSVTMERPETKEGQEPLVNPPVRIVVDASAWEAAQPKKTKVK